MGGEFVLSRTSCTDKLLRADWGRDRESDMTSRGKINMINFRPTAAFVENHGI